MQISSLTFYIRVWFFDHQKSPFLTTATFRQDSVFFRFPYLTFFFHTRALSDTLRRLRLMGLNRVCSMFVQCLFNVCSMFVQCLFNACSMVVQWLSPCVVSSVFCFEHECGCGFCFVSHEFWQIRCDCSFCDSFEPLDGAFPRFSPKRKRLRPKRR